MKGRILLLWHMHQPAYWDPVMKNIGLPWVRLHGVRGYNDLPFMARLFPHVRQTINLVPSLLDQIDQISGGELQDAYQILTMKPPEDLTPADRDYILRNFFSCPFDSMIRPNHQYVNIWQKVQTALSGKPPESQLPPDVLSNRELLDLQVLFNLVWFGYGAKHDHPEIEEWLRKGAGFSEEDKAGVMALQLSVLKELIPNYRTLAENGQIEISASPYYHPILPLLISSSIGSRPRPGIALPEEFSWPNDAKEQVLMALDRHEKLLGIRPRGMWPSEGSVCPELMDILAAAGLDWTATDQGILDESIGGAGNMTHPWQVTTGHGDLRIIFRQRALSDRIGFLYSRYNGTEAAKDLLSGIEATAGVGSGSHPPIIPIILDGENPWESYPDGGYLFLRSFFERLDNHPHLETQSIWEGIRDLPASPIHSLASGSWINHDFNIWIGHPEDNAGWNYLSRTRKFLSDAEASGKHSHETLLQAKMEMFASEGSDWFWWYGDDFQSLQAYEFDRLFRTHQQNVYRILGEDIPVYLTEPIRSREHDFAINLPTDFISPTIDGRVTHFYEWTGAGSFDPQKTQGSMFLSGAPIRKIFYGFDQINFYLRVEFDPEILSGNIDQMALVVRIHNNVEFEWKLPLLASPLDVPARVGQSAPMLWACQKMGEGALSLAAAKFSPGERLHLICELWDGERLLDQCPRGRSVPIHVPDDQFDQSIWRV